MSRYEVLVDDNSHYQDEDERYALGLFDTAEEAVAVCKAIVERCVRNYPMEPGESAEGLFRAYTMFGEDPFIVRRDSSAPQVKFSAWDYARELATARVGEA